MRIVGIIGPYFSGGNRRLIDHNIANAGYLAIKIANYFSNSKLVGFFCPHLHTARFERLANATEDYYHALDDVIYDSICEGFIMLPDWYKSEGSRRDFQRARRARDKKRFFFFFHNFNEESVGLLLRTLEVWAKTPPEEATQTMIVV